MNDEAVYAYRFAGKRFDCGSKLGYLQANVEYALAHPEQIKGLVISNMMMSIPDYNKYAEDVLAKQMDPAVVKEIHEIEKKGPLLTADARRDKQEQFERKRRDAARAADDFQKELEKKEAALLQKVLQEVGES